MLLFGSLAVSTIGVVSGIIASRALGPEGRGDFAVMTLWAALIAVALELGIADAVTLRTSSAAVNPRHAIAAGVILALLASALGIAIGWVALPVLLRGDQHQLLHSARLYLAFIPASLLGSVAHSALIGLQRFKLATIVRVASALSYVLIIAGVWLAGRLTAHSLAAVNVAAALFPVFAVSLTLARSRWVSFNANAKELRIQLQMGFRLQGARLSSAFAATEDRALANLTLSRIDIGLYQIPASLTYLMPVIPQTLSQLMFARIGAAFEKRADLVLATYVRTVLLTTAAAILIIPTLPILIPFVYGKDFSAAVLPATIVVLSSIFAAGGAVLQSSAKSALHVEACIVAEMLAIAVFAALALPLSQYAGPAGLAFGYLLGRLTSCVWMYSQPKDIIGISRFDLHPWSRRFRDSLRKDAMFVFSRFQRKQSESSPRSS